MNKRLLPLLLSSLFILSACTSAPIRTVSTAVPADHRHDMQQAILAGCKDRGWVARKVAPGAIDALLKRRAHTAEVRITYTATSYRIIYKSSDNLGYKGDKIHRNYNNWVKFLDQSILSHLR